MLGHVLRHSDKTPAVKAMKFYLERSEKGLRGRPRETIVTTLNKDITREKLRKRDFPVSTFRRKEDFEQIRSATRYLTRQKFGEKSQK